MQVDPASATAPGGDLVARLDDARGVIEAKFLSAGAIVLTTVDGVAGLIASLERMGQALNPETVRATTQDLETASRRLSGLPASHAERLDALHALIGCRASLDGRIFDMRRGLAYMRAFAVSIKVTAAGIPQASQEIGVFADDIQAGLARAGVELGELDAGLRELESNAQSARAQGSALGARLAQAFPATPDALLANARMLGDHQERIVDTTERAAVLARDIRKRVSRVLAALQIGDITRQRIEHVQTALQSLDAEPSCAASAANAGVAALMHALLGRLIAAAGADFHRDVSEINRNMGDMAGVASELMHLQDMAHGGGAHGGGAHGGHPGGNDDKGFLRVVEGRLDQARALVDEMEASDRAAALTGAATALASKALLQRVEAIQSIKSDVQYMALNTTLKCTHIGDPGRPLRVIAIELREHGGQLESSAAQTLAALGELTAVAARLSGDGEGDGAGEPSCVAAAGDAMIVASDRIRRAGDLAEGELAEIARQGRAVLDLLEQASSRLRFQEEIGDILDQAGADLEVLGSRASTFDADGSAILERLLAELAKSYTMVQEREVHQSFVDALDLNPAQDLTAEAA